MNEMQMRKHLPIGVDDLDERLSKALSDVLRQKLAIYTAAT